MNIKVSWPCSILLCKSYLAGDDCLIRFLALFNQCFMPYTQSNPCHHIGIEAITMPLYQKIKYDQIDYFIIFGFRCCFKIVFIFEKIENRQKHAGMDHVSYRKRKIMYLSKML